MSTLTSFCRSLVLASMTLWLGTCACAGDLIWDSEQWKAEVSKRKPWLEAVVKQPFPPKPVHGTYRAAAFTADAVVFYRRILQISKGEPMEGQHFIIQLPETNVEGKTYYILPGRVPANSDIRLYWYDGNMGHTERWGHANAGAMKLQFGKIKNGLLPGFVVLRVADQNGTNVEGYFYAKVSANGAFHEFDD